MVSQESRLILLPGPSFMVFLVIFTIKQGENTQHLCLFFIAVYFAALPFESDCFCSALHVDMLAIRGILVAACRFCKQALTGSLPPTEKIRRHAMIVLLRITGAV